MELAQGAAAADVLEADTVLGAAALLALQLLALVGNLACLLVGVHHVELVTGRGSAIQTQDQCRGRRTALGDADVALVEHGLDLAEVSTGQHDITHVERTVVDEHGGDVATSLVE